MACLFWVPEYNQFYDHLLDKMEQSMVKMRIAEREANLRKMSDSTVEKLPTINGTHQKDGKYYLVKLDMEVEKLKSLIEVSEKENMLGQIPEEASGKIRNACGKAQLLMRKKFTQFRELCRDNIENDPDKKETKSSDLQGYWETMFIQIDDVNALFKEIQLLKANNWVPLETDKEDGPPKAANSKSATPRNKRKSPNKSPRTKPNSVDEEKAKKEARNRLAAARKQAKLRQQQLRKEEEENNKQDESLNSSLNSSINFSFEVTSNDTTPAKNTTTAITTTIDDEKQLNDGNKVIMNGKCLHNTDDNDEASSEKKQGVTLTPENNSTQSSDLLVNGNSNENGPPSRNEPIGE